MFDEAIVSDEKADPIWLAPGEGAPARHGRNPAQLSEGRPRTRRCTALIGQDAEAMIAEHHHDEDSFLSIYVTI
jgi:hypothetical protein